MTYVRSFVLQCTGYVYIMAWHYVRTYYILVIVDTISLLTEHISIRGLWTATNIKRTNWRHNYVARL